MAAGIVYVLASEAFDNYVKSRKKINSELRLKQQDNTSVPLPFCCVYAVSVNKLHTTGKLTYENFW